MRSIRYFFKRYIHLIFFIILISLSLILLFNARTKALKGIKSFGLSFFSSFQLGFSGISGVFSGVTNHFEDVKKIREELEVTQQKLNEAYKLIDEIDDLKKQNIKLRGVIGYSYTIPSLYDSSIRIIPAQVIAKQPGNHSSCMTINKGRKDGIRMNMPVIAPYEEHQGLVGKIVTVGGNTSMVLPLYNNSFYISARFNDTEYEGLINGLGENNSHILMQYVDKNAKAEIKYGDLVISSGLGQLYPRGIHIGLVNAIKAKPYETSMECEITPLIDFSRLEHVYVIMKR
jgi:rod shape-determining protein MreC